MRIGLVLAVMMFGGVFYGLAVSRTPETEAIEPADFYAGYLIDDSVFYNPNTMTVEEIQSFLDEKSPACDMWGTGLISGRKYPDGTWVPSGTTRAEYAKTMRETYGNMKYHDPPYVCINKYYENPDTHETLYETQGVATAGMKSAAQIIYDVAQEYNVNPQVLLVLIKKESLVWGDNWPLKYEYNTVTGYGCPDGAPCNEAYYGFYNQVQKAAWQFNYYREHPNAYRYKPGQINNIQYHPNTSCGTKEVYLENIATTSLYIYTPYTPNDAALLAYPGAGDSCSSYGNRNFYMFFMEWFGSTYNKWQKMTSPRVMSVAQRTLTINAQTITLSDNWNEVGQSNLYSSKIDIFWNGEIETCLRKYSDEISGSNNCVLMSRLSEYSPEILNYEEAKYIAKRYTCEINLILNEVDCGKYYLMDGVGDFNDEVVIDDVVYLVSKEDNTRGYLKERFVSANDIKYYESPVFRTITEDSVSFSINMNEQDSSLRTGEGVVIYGEYYFGDNLLYLIGLEETPRFVKSNVVGDSNSINFKFPRYLILKKETSVVNLGTNETCEKLGADAVRFFRNKVDYDGRIFYQSEEYSGTTCYVDSQDLIEVSSIFDDFIYPRNLRAKRDSLLLNIVDNTVCGSIKEGDVFYFDSKKTKDGILYYRTRDYSTISSVCVIKAEDLEEI